MPPQIGIRQLLGAWFDHKIKTTTLADAKAAAGRGLATVKDAYEKNGISREFFREITKARP